MNYCDFCQEMEEPSKALRFLAKDWPYEDRVLYESEFAFVVPALGPLVYPYALIISKNHIIRFSSASTQLRASVFDCLRYLNHLGCFPSKKLSVFEHGSSGFGKSSCIDHMHLHVVDAKYSLMNSLRIVKPESINCVMSVEKGLNIDYSYTFAGEYSEKGFIQAVVSSDENCERQYIRRLLATITGQKEWCWRLRMNPEFMRYLADVANKSK